MNELKKKIMTKTILSSLNESNACDQIKYLTKMSRLFIDYD